MPCHVQTAKRDAILRAGEGRRVALRTRPLVFRWLLHTPTHVCIHSGGRMPASSQSRQKLIRCPRTGAKVFFDTAGAGESVGDCTVAAQHDGAQTSRSIAHGQRSRCAPCLRPLCLRNPIGSRHPSIDHILSCRTCHYIEALVLGAGSHACNPA